MGPDPADPSAPKPPISGTLLPDPTPAPAPGPEKPDPAARPAPGRPFAYILTPPQAPDEMGRLGGYRVLRLLGQGGMGLVFEAEDPALRRRVAIKCMDPGVAARPGRRERFQREARAQAQVEHENVVPIHQVGEERGVPYIVMPLLQGESLQDRLDREPRPPVAEAVRIGREVARGLAAAHARGLVHRDIKPDNLWLEAGTGRVKILDFGIARIDDGGPTQTRDGELLGTPGYLAPEQFTGEAVDHRADLFSLGCVLYHMSTGQPAFRGSNALLLLAKLATEAPPSPSELAPDLPPGLVRLIESMISRRPADRPATAAEVVAALDRIDTQPAGEYFHPPLSPISPPPATPESRQSHPTPPFRPEPTADGPWAPTPAAVPENLRRPPPTRWVVAGSAAALVVLTVGIGVMVWPSGTTGGTGTGSTGTGSGGNGGGTASTTIHEGTGGKTVGTGKVVPPITEPPKQQPGEEAYQRGLALLPWRGGQSDPKLAAELFREAAEKGHPAAQHQLANLLLYGYDAGRVDRPRGLAYEQRSAENGYAPAQAVYGHLLATGAVRPPNPGEAAGWVAKALPALRKPADERDAESQYALGLALLAAGTRDRNQNQAEAANRLKAAADAGHPTAALYLAELYGTGTGAVRDDAEQFRRLTASAGRGNAAAQLGVGKDYAAGRGVGKDDKQALEWTRKSAAQGYPPAMTEMGLISAAGRGVSVDDHEAAKWFLTAAQADDAEGMFRLGRAYFYGMGVAIDPVEAAKWYAKAADHGHRPGGFALGLLKSEGRGLPRDRADGEERVRSARAEVERLADGGDAAAADLLGEMELGGWAEEKNPEKAFDWYRKGADAGDPVAAAHLAGCYMAGSGVKADPERAAALFRTAAERGLPMAQNWMGVISARKPNETPEAADEWFRKAAQADLPDAQYTLGLRLKERDPTESKRWLDRAAMLFERSARQGDVWAEYYMGVMYESGEGVEKKDLTEAAKWYGKAAAQGSAPAKKALDRLNKG